VGQGQLEEALEKATLRYFFLFSFGPVSTCSTEARGVESRRPLKKMWVGSPVFGSRLMMARSVSRSWHASWYRKRSLVRHSVSYACGLLRLSDSAAAVWQ
jgi:hypothetical protein